MSRGKQWLVVDPQRGINQEEWILRRARRDLGLFFAPNSKESLSSYAAAVANDFDHAWRRDFVVYNKLLGRMETPDEAKKRTANQTKQAWRWVKNNWHKVIDGYKTEPRPVDLLAPPPPAPAVVRAKSARDFFIAAHPEIREETLKPLEGRTQKERTAAVNQAYTQAIQEAQKKGAFAEFDAKAQAAKAETAKARQIAGTSGSASTAESRVGDDRGTELKNAHYTLTQHVAKLAHDHKLTLFVVVGARNAENKPRKWLISSTNDAPDDVIEQLKTISGVHGILDSWVAKYTPHILPAGSPSAVPVASSSSVESPSSAPAVDPESDFCPSGWEDYTFPTGSGIQEATTSSSMQSGDPLTWPSGFTNLPSNPILNFDDPALSFALSMDFSAMSYDPTLAAPDPSGFAGLVADAPPVVLSAEAGMYQRSMAQSEWPPAQGAPASSGSPVVTSPIAQGTSSTTLALPTESVVVQPHVPEAPVAGPLTGDDPPLSVSPTVGVNQSSAAVLADLDRPAPAVIVSLIPLHPHSPLASALVPPTAGKTQSGDVPSGAVESSTAPDANLANTTTTFMPAVSSIVCEPPIARLHVPLATGLHVDLSVPEPREDPGPVATTGHGAKADSEVPHAAQTSTRLRTARKDRKVDGPDTVQILPSDAAAASTLEPEGGPRRGTRGRRPPPRDDELVCIRPKRKALNEDAVSGSSKRVKATKETGKRRK